MGISTLLRSGSFGSAHLKEPSVTTVDFILAKWKISLIVRRNKFLTASKQSDSNMNTVETSYLCYSFLIITINYQVKLFFWTVIIKILNLFLWQAYSSFLWVGLSCSIEHDLYGDHASLNYSNVVCVVLIKVLHLKISRGPQLLSTWQFSLLSKY